jgi:hypothetical protein
MPRARYAGTFGSAEIPGAPVIHGPTDATTYPKLPAPKAAAFHPNGSRLFAVSGTSSQHAAEEQALKDCNDDPQRRGMDGPCFLYAVENRVMLPLRLKEPSTPAPK